MTSETKKPPVYYYHQVVSMANFEIGETRRENKIQGIFSTFDTAQQLKAQIETENPKQNVVVNIYKIAANDLYTTGSVIYILTVRSSRFGFACDHVLHLSNNEKELYARLSSFTDPDQQSKFNESFSISKFVLDQSLYTGPKSL